jgi:hypothetical protein
MQNRTIPDSHITSSTKSSAMFAASQGRLNNVPSAISGGSWMTADGDFVPWFKVNLGKTTKIIAIGTQGNPGIEEWVTYYIVRYGFDGSHWGAIYDHGMRKVNYLFS